MVIVSRLRMLETLTRKVLLAEAVNLFDGAAPSVVKRAARSARRIGSEKPETRSTPFSLRLPREPRAARRRTARPHNFWHASTPTLPSAANIARRIEALRHVLNDPAPFARRLARMLTNALVHLARMVTRCVLFSPRRHVADPQYPSISRDVVANALAATAGFLDSS